MRKHRYHSNEDKSDFSNWVYDVISGEKLSRDLWKSAAQAQAARYVGNRIALRRLGIGIGQVDKVCLWGHCDCLRQCHST